MKERIKIRDKVIGKDAPVFITAEIGITCNYEMTITKSLIDVAQEAGADAVKFIFWFPDELMSDKTVIWKYSTVNGPAEENMYEMLNRYRFTLDEWFEIKEYADSKGIILFSTIYSQSGLDYAQKLELEAFKLSSWDFNNFPTWKKAAALGKPLIMDTGPVNTLDVAKVMDMMKQVGNEESLLVHCFHTDKYSEMNMRAIPYMAKTFNSLVGYSSDTQKSETDIIAVTMGAVFLEKRLTLDRTLPGHHHVLALEPDEFKSYVQMIRNIEAAQGMYDLRPSPNDLKERKKWFRHLCLAKDVSAGTILTEEILVSKRPEKGISPEFIEVFLGRPLKRDMKENEAISFSDI